MSTHTTGGLYAISDLHVGHEENRAHVEELRPHHPDDWLLVAGDVAEYAESVVSTLRTLAGRFRQVVWVPGNHELWTPPKDPLQLRGVARYEYLVERCRELGVLTPEDPYPVWEGPGGPVTVAPLFLLYDYSYRREGLATAEQALARAHEAGVVCTDEYLLHPDPYPGRADWCRARVELTRRRLDELDPAQPLVLVNHYPLDRHPTRVLRYPDFALWCGTEATASWHREYNVAAMVYGHLHIPRTTWADGVRFEEVSVGYPREWKPRGGPTPLRRILPSPHAAQDLHAAQDPHAARAEESK